MKEIYLKMAIRNLETAKRDIWSLIGEIEYEESVIKYINARAEITEIIKNLIKK